MSYYPAGIDDDLDGTVDEAGEACPPEQAVGGEILGVETTSLFVAGAIANCRLDNSNSWSNCSWNSRLFTKKQNQIKIKRYKR
jgi:hypothetical protein